MRLFLSLLLISSLSTAAHAEGIYVEGGSLTRHYDLTVPGATASSDSAKGHAVAAALRLGYEIDDRWAVEAGYFNQGSPGYAYRLGGQMGDLPAMVTPGCWPVATRLH